MALDPIVPFQLCCWALKHEHTHEEVCMWQCVCVYVTVQVCVLVCLFTPVAGIGPTLCHKILAFKQTAVNSVRVCVCMSNPAHTMCLLFFVDLLCIDRYVVGMYYHHCPSLHFWAKLSCWWSESSCLSAGLFVFFTRYPSSSAWS